MISIAAYRKLALSFEEAEEIPHFEKPSFRIRKKIFATFDLKNNRACLKLSLIDQSVFCAFDSNIIYPVPNKWGKQGWTFVELKKVRTDLFKDALTCAYCEIAPKELSAKYKRD
ncbi:MmcQ/YjbR family DNA-binding protein [Aurantibacillus circumpalustris]|uniref:MmcQ/YjbR family DNA-binding protein n=1 Tax=Aurantibacillus circumpalustris TaxID=3036359 RepID=UPI00295BB77A|nr:MmcQ/YjbR family DNA-binding protein [Aurantibacillus circumpalustris]